MSVRVIWLVPALLSAAVAFAQTPPKQAHADIVNAQGQKIGAAKIKATKGGVKIEASLEHLPPGIHGIHIHAAGKCDAPAFTTAGGHFNPGMKHHGKDNPEGPHAGDLPNFTVGANGKAKINTIDRDVTLDGGPNSLFHEGGASLVIHAAPDDYKTDPSGNSGARIACGVIEK